MEMIISNMYFGEDSCCLILMYEYDWAVFPRVMKILRNVYILWLRIYRSFLGRFCCHGDKFGNGKKKKNVSYYVSKFDAQLTYWTYMYKIAFREILNVQLWSE